MGLFDFFKKKKVELTEEQCKWNKMWELWTKEKAESPYAQLMTYQSEINNGGHDQYFTNVENTMNIQHEISVLETILPVTHKNNLRKAYNAYLVLKDKEDEHSEEILNQCDDVFYENEAELNDILEKYAKTIEL
ncbi:MAG: DUF4375 domain-containing protein [Clostridia bacterium]|nr:DUF4375 domain-containing protein [Clostridia bacterium]